MLAAMVIGHSSPSGRREDETADPCGASDEFMRLSHADQASLKGVGVREIHLLSH